MAITKATHDQQVHEFPNGYKASVICKPGISYGGDSELFEIRVYQKAITGDYRPVEVLDCNKDGIIGWLTEEQVYDYLAKIEAF